MSQGRDRRRAELGDWYDRQVDGFRAVEAAVRAHVGGALATARLDDARLETRTKARESFLAKAGKSDGRGGFKYADPATEADVFASLKRLALGRTVVLASHSAAAHAFSGRRLDLRGGKAQAAA